jgi:hypothetical protein
MALQAGQELSYQRLLRAIGAYLDHEPIGRFRLIEMPDGFTVITERGTAKPQLQDLHFERATLAEQADQLVRGRNVFGGRHRYEWPLCRAGHEDFLRALGFELDDSEARAVSLDELEDGVVVTYSYLDPTQGYSWRKRFVLLRAIDIEEIMKAAHSRRRKGFLNLRR